MICYVIYNEIFLSLFVVFHFLGKLLCHSIQGLLGGNINKRKYLIPFKSIFIFLSLFAKKAESPLRHVHRVLDFKTGFLIFQKLSN